MLKLSRSPFLLTAFAAILAAPLAAQQLEIVDAAYGAGNYQMNVSQKLRGMIRNNTLDVSVDPAVLGGDPAPGSAKSLRIVYRYGGRQYETSGKDFARIQLPAGAAAPAPAAVPAAPGGFSLGDLWGSITGGSSALRIVSARYGEGSSVADVRDRLQNLVRNDALSVKVDNAAMGGDPAVARNKALEVVYEYRGTTFQTTVKEGATLNLPDANARAVAAPVTPAQPTAAAVAPLQIVSARYGGDNRYMDVLARLQAMVGNNQSYSVRVDNATMGGDPAVSKDKYLEVVYEYNGGRYSASAKEGRSLNLPDSGATRIGDAAPPAVSSTRGPDSDAARSAGGRRRVGGPVATTPSGGREVIPIGRTGGLRIFYARYGAPGQEIDVREQLRPMLQPEALNIVVGKDSMGGDPAPGVLKTITVLYEFRGRTYEKTATDGQTLVLP